MVITMDYYTPESITVTFHDKNALIYGITWLTKANGEAVIQIKEDDKNDDFSSSREIKCLTYERCGLIYNKGIITNLRYDTRYRYRVGSPAHKSFSESAVFKTRPENIEDFTFLYMSDSQDGDAEYGSLWKMAFEHAKAHHSEAAFLLHGGDIIQNSGDEKLWKNMFEDIREYAMSLPIMPASGNHDYWRGGYLLGRLHLINDHFNISLCEQNTENGIYYSFDYGHCHFTVLNSGDFIETNGGLKKTQLDWLENDLKRTEKKWKIVMIHNPIHSPGKYGSQDGWWTVPKKALKPQLTPIFGKYHVDLCLCGHDHVYSKSYPVTEYDQPCIGYHYENNVIDGIAAKFAVRPHGTIHHLAGCCGAQNREPIEYIKGQHLRYLEEFEAMKENASAYSAVSISENTLCVHYYMLDKNGTISQKIWGIIK